MSSIRRQVLEGIFAFSEQTGISKRRIGVEAVNDSHLVRRLRLGHGTQLSTLERLEAWMSAELERRAKMSEAA